MVGGENSPAIPMIMVVAGYMIDEKGLVMVTSCVEYSPLHSIVELFILAVFP